MCSSNNVDVIVFSIFDNQYNQCSDKPVGTYYVPVPKFVQAYTNQKSQDMYDQGIDYELPDVAQYIYCTPFEIQGQYKYFQVGCADDSLTSLAVNIYEDKDCTTRSQVDGNDDSVIDVSEIHVSSNLAIVVSQTHRLLQPTFKKCRACVNWFDRDDDAQLDDAFYENRKKIAPLCSTAWTYKENCGRKCQRIGTEHSLGEGWSPSDKVLLAILSAFGLILLGLIFNQRRKMSNKDTLLEQAALSTAGLQQPHVIGIFVLVVLIVAVFVLLGLKNITWALLLLVNTTLFAYLMRLTVRATEPIIGPNGEILRQDSDDSSLISDSGNKNGTYVLPTIS